jgi:adenylate cyclase
MGNVANRYKQEAKDLEKVGIQSEHLVGMLNMIRHINEAKSLRDATTIVVEEACSMLNCDRATVFIVDKENEHLVIKHATNDDALDIRIPWNTGIVGHVYMSGETVNIPDAYKDDRFNQEADVATGYKTTSILCCPITDANGVTEAVLQCINKKGPKEGVYVPFVEKDIFILDHLRSQLGVILQNYMILDMQRATQERINALLDIIKSVNSGMGTASLIFTLTNRTPALVHAQRCTVFMIDHGRQEIYSMQGAVEIRIPMTSGLAGAVATTGEPLNIRDAYKDSRFNQEFDLKNKFRTKQVLVLPIKSAGGDRVIGVIQLINKEVGEVFTDQDIDLLNIFLAIAGGILEQSVVITRQKRRLTEFERMTTAHTTKGTGAMDSGVSSLGSFAEEEEDEEDDEGDE